MQTGEDLVKNLSVRLSKAETEKLATQLAASGFGLKDIIDITFHSDKNIAFRAAWLLENVLMHHANTYAGSLPYLIHRFAGVSYPSNQRHYANIMIRLTSAKAGNDIQQNLAQTDMEPVVEKLFDWLIDPEVLVAVKCSAAEALMHLSRRYHWIAEELVNQLHFLMRNGSAAMQARGKMILKTLKR